MGYLAYTVTDTAGMEAPAELAISVTDPPWYWSVSLCAKDTDTVTHISTHIVSSQNKSVTKSELGLNQSMILS